MSVKQVALPSPIASQTLAENRSTLHESPSEGQYGRSHFTLSFADLKGRLIGLKKIQYAWCVAIEQTYRQCSYRPIIIAISPIW
ncbi:MAG TPA: hypothetical protein V6C84_00660 [Coleofasciculaceae cyanobacterium]